MYNLTEIFHIYHIKTKTDIQLESKTVNEFKKFKKKSMRHS